LHQTIDHANFWFWFDSFFALILCLDVWSVLLVLICLTLGATLEQFDAMTIEVPERFYAATTVAFAHDSVMVMVITTVLEDLALRLSRSARHLAQRALWARLMSCRVCLERMYVPRASCFGLRKGAANASNFARIFKRSRISAML